MFNSEERKRMEDILKRYTEGLSAGYTPRNNPWWHRMRPYLDWLDRLKKELRESKDRKVPDGLWE
jgi:hypothetical protein